MEDFRQGNVVNCFEVTSGGRPDPNFNWERLYPAPHPSAEDKYHSEHASFLAAKVLAIANGELTLVEMEPVYGADLLAVCRSATLQFAS